MFPMTPWVKRLLIANAVAFIATMAYRPLYTGGALVPFAVLIRPWTIFTYMFLHADLMHLFFNMIGLMFFGPRLEERLGGRDFLWLYFLGGIGGAAFSFIFAPSAAVIGASAAVYAVLLAFALYWPYERILIWGILPVPAWALATFLVLGSLWSGVSGTNSGTAHFAHLGGLAFGFAYLKWRDWRRGAAKRDFQRKLNQAPPATDGTTGDRAALKRWQSIDLNRLHELNREEVVHLLDKVNRLGPRSLTMAERQFLERLTTTH
jgi:membrane associated rhomboid family serine protease